VGRIRILSPHIVNKIAAGEVIERPASVVKELAENAVDAKARRLEVALEEGGKRLIRVADDGEGIQPEDLPLAVTSHATSKLRDPDELFHILTLGFRGEALASIGAVSQMSVRSRVRGGGEGFEIEVQCGEVGAVRPAPAREGTVVEVRNLFQNVPVRMRFLRSASAELGHVAEALTRIALAHPELAVELVHGEREVLQLDAGEDRRERVARLFGRELAEALLPVRHEAPGLRIEGLVAPPHFDRSRQDRLYLLLNGRYIRDRSLQHAIREAFQGYLMSGRHPTVFLALDVDPAEVDVNVHPTKIEVRLREAGSLFRAVRNAVRASLERGQTPPRVGPPVAEASGPASAAAPAPSIREEVASFLRSREGFAGAPRDLASTPSPSRVADPASASPAPPPLAPRREALRETSVPDASSIEPRQILASYILRETGDGILLTDQHALHERILYHRMRERIEAGGIATQRLLLPEIVELSIAQVELLVDRADELRTLGFEVARFGERSVAVHAVPEILRRLAASDWIRHLLTTLETREEGGKDFRDRVIETAACKAAVKAGESLGRDEMLDLLRQAEALPSSYSCPHGRPTTVEIPRAEIERWFRRR